MIGYSTSWIENHLFILKSSNWDFWLSNHQSQQKVLIPHSQRLTHLCVLIAHPVTTEGLVPKTNPINVQSIQFPSEIVEFWKFPNSTDVCYWYFSYFPRISEGTNIFFLGKKNRFLKEQHGTHRNLEMWDFFRDFLLGFKTWDQVKVIFSFPSIVDVHRCFWPIFSNPCTLYSYNLTVNSFPFQACATTVTNDFNHLPHPMTFTPSFSPFAEWVDGWYLDCLDILNKIGWYSDV